MLTASAAMAASPIAKVGTASVVPGKRAIEHRIGYTRDESGTNDNRRLRMLELLDYSFNDTQAIRLITEQDKRHSDNVEHRGVGIEYWHQFFERRTDGWDGAIRLTYAQRDNDKRPNAASIRFMGQGPLAPKWSWRQNLIFSRSLGAEQQSSFAIEWRSTALRTMAVTPDNTLQTWQLGVEMFNDVGRLNSLHGYSEQDHQLGPVANFAFTGGVSVQLGYRAGISKGAANHSYKLFTSVTF